MVKENWPSRCSGKYAELFNDKAFRTKTRTSAEQKNGAVRFRFSPIDFSQRLIIIRDPSNRLSQVQKQSLEEVKVHLTLSMAIMARIKVLASKRLLKAKPLSEKMSAKPKETFAYLVR